MKTHRDPHPSRDLTFGEVSLINAQRASRWHEGFPGGEKDGWMGSDWSNAMQGEAGELAEVLGALTALRLGNLIATHAGLAGNVVKKLRRIETSIQQMVMVGYTPAQTQDLLLAKLSTEIGDTFLYLDLLAQFYGLDLAECVVETFNRVSRREGFPERIETDDA